jgi:hypothetical protein
MIEKRRSGCADGYPEGCPRCSVVGREDGLAAVYGFIKFRSSAGMWLSVAAVQ